MSVQRIRVASAMLLAVFAIVASACGGIAPAVRVDAFGNAPSDAPGPTFYQDDEGSGRWQHHL